ncbi:MAG: TatD family hydrolase [Pseudoflavonifractor sp.]
MYFDTHAHYYDEAFDPDREALLSGLPDRGVGLVLCPGCDLPTSEAAIALARQYPHVYAAVGFHPENLEGAQARDLDRMEALAREEKVKAIGEIGLDYYWEKDPAARKNQRDFFAAQLLLAEKLDLPAIVHDREAHGDCLELLRAHPGTRGVMHCYSGGLEDAKALVRMGWMLSFTGSISFKNARKAPEVLAWLPLEHIMLETDAPYMAPEPFRGKRCDSGYLYRMAEVIGAVKGLPAAEIEARTTENAKKFFKIRED